jgi:hypothetical protein
MKDENESSRYTYKEIGEEESGTGVREWSLISFQIDRERTK